MVKSTRYLLCCPSSTFIHSSMHLYVNDLLLLFSRHGHMVCHTSTTAVSQSLHEIAAQQILHIKLPVSTTAWVNNAPCNLVPLVLTFGVVGASSQPLNCLKESQACSSQERTW